MKRDELNHTGAHKINNVLGQIILARRMGKTRIIAETGAGQHGVATATVCAKFGLKCVVYMGAHDVERQAPNVFRMKLLGAEVVPVTSGRGTLKDAMNDALRDWVTNVRDTFYCIGTVAGPHPYPAMVRDFQAIIGKEAKEQMLDVPVQLMIEQGAVSIEVVEAMALARLDKSLADVSLSISGVAGPGGGSTGKPVGTVCFAVAQRQKGVISVQKLFAGNRQEIRQQAVLHALAMLIDILEKNS